MTDYAVYCHGREIKAGLLLEKFDEEAVGIFETMRTYGGRIFEVNRHLKRLAESAATAGVGGLADLRILRRELEAACTAHGLNRGSGDLWVRLTLWQDEIFVMIGPCRDPGKLYEIGVVLKTSAVARSLSHAAAPETKTSAYQNQIFASLDPLGPVFELLFLDARGFVTEVRIGNIFMIKRGELLTPPLAGILNGITRTFVLECARFAGLKARTTCLTRHDFYNADEAFLTNTSWEILPVQSLDGRQIGRTIPGEQTRKLHSIFKRRARKACRRNAPNAL